MPSVKTRLQIGADLYSLTCTLLPANTIFGFKNPNWLIPFGYVLDIGHTHTQIYCFRPGDNLGASYGAERIFAVRPAQDFKYFLGGNEGNPHQLIKTHVWGYRGLVVMYVTLNHTTGGCEGVHLGQGGGGGGGWENQRNGTNTVRKSSRTGTSKEKKNAKQTPRLAPAGTGADLCSLKCTLFYCCKSILEVWALKIESITK